MNVKMSIPTIWLWVLLAANIVGAEEQISTKTTSENTKEKVNSTLQNDWYGEISMIPKIMKEMKQKKETLKSNLKIVIDETDEYKKAKKEWKTFHKTPEQLNSEIFKIWKSFYALVEEYGCKTDTLEGVMYFNIIIQSTEWIDNALNLYRVCSVNNWKVRMHFNNFKEIFIRELGVSDFNIKNLDEAKKLMITLLKNDLKEYLVMKINEEYIDEEKKQEYEIALINLNKNYYEQ